MTQGARRPSRVVCIGDLKIGGDHPILIQSMTITDTLDTTALVEEIGQLVRAGCPLVRLAVASVRAAENLPTIRDEMVRRGLRVPLVADIHFTPAAALIAAKHCEKVRINPGNYADRKRFAEREYSDVEYAAELDRVTDRFLPLVALLKKTGAALRIGTNHGSLSDRIMNRYGDTPEGMVESALEFVRICESVGFHEIVVSIKSSIPAVMVEANRLLARRMAEESMAYPIHLGVTEAGGGLEGRVKSAIGIGTLLLDGIGDTIRVSLTEESVHEIEACRAILQATERQTAAARQIPWTPPPPPPSSRRTTREISIDGVVCGAHHPPRVEVRMQHIPSQSGETEAAAEEARSYLSPHALTAPCRVAEILSVTIPPSKRPGEQIAPLASFHDALGDLKSDTAILFEWDLRSPGEIHAIEPLLPFTDAIGARFPIGTEIGTDKVALLARLAKRTAKPIRFRIQWNEESGRAADWPAQAGQAAGELARIAIEEDCTAISFLLAGPNLAAVARAVDRSLDAVAPTREIPLFFELPENPIEASIAGGSVCVDRLADGLSMPGRPAATPADAEGTITGDPVGLAYTILQGCRLRLTRAEFIACPSCGRTQFDLQATTRRIQEKTAHLAGVKIAIMGCIVNGPGEMADADFGYVGSGPGRVDLYAGRTRVHQAVEAEDADQRLIELIREHGRWTEPPAEQT